MLPNRRGRAWNEQKRDALLELARKSLPDPAGRCSNEVMLHCYINLLTTYQKAIDEVEDRMNLLAHSFPA
ncbi:hypothetical protein GE107_18760 [Cohnella sp. CFH 77786]|uniref:hypothetical protein n=1 Tax=Cohnella sp. CFH 77786 TaxID=2662265 RepID=UPI001C6102D8|nr:hypothetical protein [Cohnella sp. CFH 77786]MBW5448102.1 hypothetical protein [Cohnella sp. CFH 77786]